MKRKEWTPGDPAPVPPDPRTEAEIMAHWNGDVESPLVSICCITYNHEPYIKDALNGFLIQETDFPFEILIHDDASTDNTIRIIKEYENRYPKIIKPIYQTENKYSQGIKINNVYQFPRARGKYIALCEGDDYWIDPLKIQKQHQFLEENRDVSMCFHNAHVLQGNKYVDGEFPHFKGIFNNYFTSTQLFDKWVVPTASIIFKRKCLNLSKILDSRILNGDVVIVLAMAECGKVYGMKDYMSVYRINREGLTISRQKDDKKLCKKYLDHYFFLKEKFPQVSKKSFDKKISKTYFYSFIHSINSSSIDFKALWMSIVTSPTNFIIVFICAGINFSKRTLLQKIWFFRKKVETENC